MSGDMDVRSLTVYNAAIDIESVISFLESHLVRPKKNNELGCNSRAATNNRMKEQRTYN